MRLQSFLALSVLSAASALVLPFIARDEQHWSSNLEPYDVYHARYLEIGCINQHNTQFFTQCCHPRLKNADLSKIPDQCLGNDDFCDGDGNTDPSLPLPTSVLPTPAPAPTPTTHHSTSTSTPKPTATSTSQNILSGSGRGTFFYQGGNAGACGKVHSDSSKVVALDSRLYTQRNFCGKTIHITNTKNGKTVTATVADECPTCESKGSVDMSVGAFTEIATENEGDVPITWVIDLL